MNQKKSYMFVTIFAVIVVVAGALVAQGDLLKGNFGGNMPLSSPVSATKPLSTTNLVTPPAWSSFKYTKEQVAKLSSAGQTVISGEALPVKDLPVGNQQPWIKRIQFAYLLEKTLLGGSGAFGPNSFPGCKQMVADYGTPRLDVKDPNLGPGIVCYVVTKGIMPTLSAPVKNSFNGGQNISRVVAAGMLQRAFDPLAESQKPQSYYVDMMKAPATNPNTVYQDVYTDVSPYMWHVYWLAAVEASDVEPWTGKKFRPNDPLTVPEAMSWLKAIYNKLPKSGWIK